MIPKENIHKIRFDTIKLVVVSASDIYVGAKNIVQYLNLPSPPNEYRKMENLGMTMEDFELPAEFGGKGRPQKFILVDEAERYFSVYNTPHSRFKPPTGFVESMRMLKQDMVKVIYDYLGELPEFKSMPVPTEPTTDDEPALLTEEPTVETEDADEEEREPTLEEKQLSLRKRIRALQLEMFSIEVLLTNALDELNQVADNISVFKKRMRGVLRDAQKINKPEE